jgi:tetratricopeptide (TPR) repeat protein
MIAAPATFEQFLGHVGLSVLHTARGRARDALVALEKAVTTPGIAPFNRGMMRARQARLLLRRGDSATALAHVQQAQPDVTNRDQEFEVLQILAIAQAATGNVAASETTLSRLEARAKMLPSERELRRLPWARGEIALNRGDAATAVTELTRALGMLPAHGPVLGPPSAHGPLWFAAALANIARRDADAAALFERLQTQYDRASISMPTRGASTCSARSANDRTWRARRSIPDSSISGRG